MLDEGGALHVPYHDDLLSGVLRVYDSCCAHLRIGAHHKLPRTAIRADRVQIPLSAFLISCKETGMAEQKCCQAGFL